MEGNSFAFAPKVAIIASRLPVSPGKANTGGISELGSGAGVGLGSGAGFDSFTPKQYQGFGGFGILDFACRLRAAFCSFRCRLMLFCAIVNISSEPCKH